MRWPNQRAPKSLTENRLWVAHGFRRNLRWRYFDTCWQGVTPTGELPVPLILAYPARGIQSGT
jgi:hypothetical protein